MDWIIIFLIGIVIFVILVIIGIVIYFLLNRSSGPPPPPPPGSKPPVPPAGNTGPVPANIVPGIFSVNSVADPTKYLTIGTNSDPTSTENPPLVGSSDTSIPCTNYSWQNLYNYNPYPGSNSIIPSSLVSYVTTITEGNFTQNIPPNFLVTNFFGSSPSVLLSQSAVSIIGGNDDVTWNYDSTNKSWCAPQGSLANTCLYLETDNTISSKTFNASDKRFQWNNVAALVPPTCLPI